MKEEDIRPKEIFDKYLKLSIDDCTNFFKDEARNHFKCPVHDEAQGIDIFKKNGFSYKNVKFVLQYMFLQDILYRNMRIFI